MFYEVALFLWLHSRSRFVAVWPEIGLEARTSRVQARASLGLISLPARAIVRHFHNGNGSVVIFDQLDYGSYYDLPTDGTVYQG